MRRIAAADQETLRQAAIYTVSAAAELAGMHPQTLRQYDRLGLVCPRRTSGRGRRYSANDIEQLRLVQQLSQDDGVNLAGIAQILRLRRENQRLRQQNRYLKQALMHAQHAGQSARQRGDRTFAASASGRIFSYGSGGEADASSTIISARKRMLIRYRPVETV